MPMLGSIDANRGDYQNGWDTDQFLIDLYEMVQAMMVIVRGGLQGGGGTNFDAKTRRNSTDPEDIFIPHRRDGRHGPRCCSSPPTFSTTRPTKRCSPNVTPPTTQAKAGFFEEGKLTLSRSPTTPAGTNPSSAAANRSCSKRS